MKEKSVLHDTVNSQKNWTYKVLLLVHVLESCLRWHGQVHLQVSPSTNKQSHIPAKLLLVHVSFFVVLRILLQPISHTKIRIPSSKNLTIEERTRSWRWLPSLLWFPWSGQQLHSRRIHDAMQGRVVDGEYASQGVDAVGQRRCGGGGSSCRMWDTEGHRLVLDPRGGGGQEPILGEGLTHGASLAARTTGRRRRPRSSAL